MALLIAHIEKYEKPKFLSSTKRTELATPMSSNRASNDNGGLSVLFAGGADDKFLCSRRNAKRLNLPPFHFLHSIDFFFKLKSFIVMMHIKINELTQNKTN